MKELKSYNEYKLPLGNEEKRWYFGQDISSHWYMYPAELKEKWDEMYDIDEDDYDAYDEFTDIFGEYKLGGGNWRIEQISFENPKKEK